MKEEIEEFEINLDYVTIPALDELSSKEKFIIYFQYDYIIKLRNLQVFLNSKFNEDSESSEILDYLKSFINLKELDYFYEFLKSLQVVNLREFELFFKAIKMNYELMIRQRSSARTLNISVESFARVKGIYYPCYESMEVIFQENDCFYKKTEKLENLTKYIVKPIF
ncbi:hypothetical protein [Cetobacterium sp.]